MSRHEIEDKRIIYTQFFCFLAAFLITIIFPKTTQNFKAADSLVMTGTVLLAIKLARDGWEIAAAGFTLLAIAWGGYFIQHDISGESGKGILASSFYFFLPSMLMICFYQPFPWWLKLITLSSVIAPFIILVIESSGSDAGQLRAWTGINFKFLHFTTLCWGSFFVYSLLRNRDKPKQS